MDRTRFYKIREINDDLPYVQLKGRIIRKEFVGEKRAKRLVALLKDETGMMELVWFQGIKWVDEKIILEKEYVVFGKPSLFKGKFNITHPETDLLSEARSYPSGFQPVYNTSEKLKSIGLDTRGVSKLIRTLLISCNDEIKKNNNLFPENLSPSLISQYKFPERFKAICNAHFPDTPENLNHARKRLKFEEFFFLQLGMLRQKNARKKNIRGYPFTKLGDNFNLFYKEHLPFELTEAQKKVIREIRTDLGSGKHMNRLLQGDVGSGKTIVALFTILLALDNGYQTCLMAPTEILSNQHFDSLSELLKGMDIKIGLLTGSTKKKNRTVLHQSLEDGNLNILIGTHAILEDPVKFKNLGLAIIDEQHRFGVEQRSKLWRKNESPPHILVMTATPIPRTLAMTLYGDLDSSIIDQMPLGRKPIKTIHKYDSHRIQVFGFMKEQIKLGRQIYVVYPLIEESEKMDFKDLMDGFESIVRAFPLPDYAVSIVHGKMKPSDKDFEMQRFLKKETQIMVATTVIEVGVNVPNASVMVIESAERFGLSQLHQLRGRVGRGADQSYCVLMTSYKLGEETKTRIETMLRTNDGFEIADTDLHLRGPGELRGTRQSGVLDLKIADLAKDSEILKAARFSAMEILEKDPDLLHQDHQGILNHIRKIEFSGSVWEKIS